MTGRSGGLTLGERIRRARKTARLEQKDLAAAVAVTQQTVSNWEDKRIIPDGKYYERLADVLHIDLVEFLRWIADEHRERETRLRRELVEVRRDNEKSRKTLEQAADKLEAFIPHYQQFNDWMATSSPALQLLLDRALPLQNIYEGFRDEIPLLREEIAKLNEEIAKLNSPDAAPG